MCVSTMPYMLIALIDMNPFAYDIARERDLCAFVQQQANPKSIFTMHISIENDYVVHYIMTIMWSHFSTLWVTLQS